MINRELETVDLGERSSVWFTKFEGNKTARGYWDIMNYGNYSVPESIRSHIGKDLVC